MMAKKHIGYIENGINIDHIPHGNAWYIMKILNLFSSSSQAGVGLNLPSHKLGAKDLIKVEDRTLTQKEVDIISLFAVGSTLSVIKNFVVIDKQILHLPPEINDLLVCPNKRCVSQEYNSKFRTFIKSINERSCTGVKCHYCEREFLLEEIKEYKF
ncbi:MAG: aspartate carbamoyltransferase regulatory subunit [Pseudomonadota bacterium]|nr:aspartate carbamoyltransferase regulatory subunit [Pseudomonadota bacterium]